ncbi:MAG TPA: hypothetical protein VFM18_19885 [Methanosarcina sp.]|nr:hypothetical protein [Methanosarcina sp.]
MSIGNSLKVYPYTCLVLLGWIIFSIGVGVEESIGVGLIVLGLGIIFTFGIVGMAKHLGPPI